MIQAVRRIADGKILFPKLTKGKRPEEGISKLFPPRRGDDALNNASCVKK